MNRYKKYLILILFILCYLDGITQTKNISISNFHFENQFGNFSFIDSNCNMKFINNNIIYYQNFDSSVKYYKVLDTAFLEILTYSRIPVPVYKKIKIILHDKEILFELSDTILSLEHIMNYLKVQNISTDKTIVFDPIPNFSFGSVKMYFDNAARVMNFEFTSRNGFLLLGIESELFQDNKYSWGFFNGMVTNVQKFEFMINNYYESNNPQYLQYINMNNLQGYYFVALDNDSKGFKKIYKFSTPIRNNQNRVDDSELFLNLKRKNYRGYNKYDVLNWQKKTIEFYKNHNLYTRYLGIIHRD